MSQTLFQNELAKFLKEPYLNEIRYDITRLVKLYLSSQDTSEKCLLKKLDEFDFGKDKVDIYSFRKISYFIRCLSEEKVVFQQEIINFFKKQIHPQLNLDNPKYYAELLDTLFLINRDDEQFYIKEYYGVFGTTKLLFNINLTFQEIFKEIGRNDDFVNSFIQTIAHSTKHFSAYSMADGFMHISSFTDDELKKALFTILKFFGRIVNKEQLLYHNVYSGIISYDSSYNGEYDGFFSRLGTLKFNSQEIENIKTFLYGDALFSLNKFNRNLLENIFLVALTNIVVENDPRYIIGFKKYDDRDLYGIESYLLNYLEIGNIHLLIDAFSDSKKNGYLLYLIYDHLKFSHKRDKSELIKIFEESDDFGEKILSRNEKIEKRISEERQVTENHLKEQKKEFLSLLEPPAGAFHYKLFYDYLQCTQDKVLEKILNKEEIQLVEAAVKRQVLIYLKWVSVSRYTATVKNWITYEDIGFRQANITIHAHHLVQILRLAQLLSLDISSYYKTFILFYPFFHQEKNIIFGIINQISSADINFILALYSRDLHEKALNLKYYNIDAFIDFYKQYEAYFSGYQKNQALKILMDVIANLDRYKPNKNLDSYIEIIFNLTNEGFIEKLWGKNHPRSNYFQDFLINGGVSLQWQLALALNRIRILIFQKRSAVIWCIDQLQNGLIEYPDPFKSSLGNLHFDIHYASPLLRELQNTDNFGNVFLQIPKIDIRTDILNLMNTALNLKKSIYDGIKSENYTLYFNYLINIIKGYLLNLDEQYRTKRYYFEFRKLVEGFDQKVTFDLDLSRIRDAFGSNDLEEEAISIENAGLSKIINLLGERNLLQKELGDFYIANRELEIKMHQQAKELKQIEQLNSDTIVLVEGKSDKIYLEYAYNILAPAIKKPFIISCGGARQLGSLLKAYSDSNDNDRLVIGIVDFDSAGIDVFKNFKDHKGDDNGFLQEEYKLGRTKKHNQQNIYLMFLPVPDNEIQNQVFYWSKENNCHQTFDFPIMTIEHLFYNTGSNIIGFPSQLFTEQTSAGNGTIIALNLPDNQKARNAEQISNLARSNQSIFVNFQVMIDLIEKIRSATV